MNSVNLNEFIEWTRQNSQRKVTIEVKNGKADIRVYDYTVGYYGQTVHSVAEIDLQGVQDRYERKEFERLKAKFAPPAPEINQPTADDEAAKDFELLEAARNGSEGVNYV